MWPWSASRILNVAGNTNSRPRKCSASVKRSIANIASRADDASVLASSNCAPIA
jgi:hypothetical protein